MLCRFADSVIFWGEMVLRQLTNPALPGYTINKYDIA